MGEPTEEWRHFLCTYSPTPDDPKCQRDATWHGMVITDDDLLAMESCDEHMPVMAQLAHYVHPLVHPCGVPGSLFRWPENECYTEWDEHAEFTQVLTAGAS